MPGKEPERTQDKGGLDRTVGMSKPKNPRESVRDYRVGWTGFVD
jgi:hypothetical protein